MDTGLPTRRSPRTGRPAVPSSPEGWSWLGIAPPRPPRASTLPFPLVGNSGGDGARHAAQASPVRVPVPAPVLRGVGLATAATVAVTGGAVALTGTGAAPPGQELTLATQQGAAALVPSPVAAVVPAPVAAPAPPTAAVLDTGVLSDAVARAQDEARRLADDARAKEAQARDAQARAERAEAEDDDDEDDRRAAEQARRVGRLAEPDRRRRPPSSASSTPGSWVRSSRPCAPPRSSSGAPSASRRCWASPAAAPHRTTPGPRAGLHGRPGDGRPAGGMCDPPPRGAGHQLRHLAPAHRHRQWLPAHVRPGRGDGEPLRPRPHLLQPGAGSGRRVPAEGLLDLSVLPARPDSLPMRSRDE